MVDFTDQLAVLDQAVEAGLADDALYFEGGGEDDGVPVRIMLDHPREVERLSGMSFTRTRPVLRVAKAACPNLKSGDAFEHRGDRWEIAEAPTAEGDGRWFMAEVQRG